MQMAQAILWDVRDGFMVLWLFHGHLVALVNLAHHALDIAKSKGHEAVMLLAVSAQDCLFVNLLFNPFRPGCLTLQATEILLRKRPISLDSHVMIFKSMPLATWDWFLRPMCEQLKISDLQPSAIAKRMSGIPEFYLKLSPNLSTGEETAKAVGLGIIPNQKEVFSHHFTDQS